MAVSKKKQESNRRWDRANLDQILVKFPKGTKEMIRQKTDGSINGFICKAVEKMLAEEAPVPPDAGE